jgi:hypothetical protein
MPRNALSRAGLQTAFDAAVAPKTALRALRANPTWRWAFCISALLGMIGALAISPVVAHTLERELPARFAADARVAQLPADQRDAFIGGQIRLAQTLATFSFALVPFGLAIGCGVQAGIMLLANALGKGDGTPRAFWALAVNAAVVGTGMSSIALTAIVLLRGAGGFASAADIAGALPGPGTFVPLQAGGTAAYLDVLNVFAVWNMLLLAAGMMIVARLPRGIAITAALVILLGTGLIPVAGAALQK